MINGARDSVSVCVQSQTRIVTPAAAPVVRIKINSLTMDRRMLRSQLTKNAGEGAEIDFVDGSGGGALTFCARR
jgi:hypothetical protein